MDSYLLENCRVLDVANGRYLDERAVAVESGLIVDILNSSPGTTEFHRIDLNGRVLMPGLIDAHIHVIAIQMDLGGLQMMPPSLVAAGACAKMEAMLLRGFTAGRDAGGADSGLVEAVNRGYIKGPRLFVSGKALSQTGGHGDWRTINMSSDSQHVGPSISRIADGITAVRNSARDELRKGAHQIKLMVNGGISTPNDPITNLQYSESELVAAVEEASAWGTYVMAHAYTAASIKRAVRAGIRSIEHANLIDEETARYVVEKEAFVVPTLSTFEVTTKFGRELGFPLTSMQKLAEVWESGMASVETCMRAGVRLGLGTDLLGPLDCHQARELQIRGDLATPAEAIRSATLVNAEILNMKGKLGIIAPGAFADMLVIDGDPLKDLSVFAGPERFLKGVIKGGTFCKWTI